MEPDDDPYRHLRQAYDTSKWQRILNAHPVPPRSAQRRGQVYVTARIEWERDGVEYLDTVCVGWTSQLVLVELAPRETRHKFLAVWLDAADVRRRAPER